MPTPSLQSRRIPGRGQRRFELIDEETGTTTTAFFPESSPREWQRYLDLAEQKYAENDVLAAFDRSRLEREGCSMFWLVQDIEGRVLGGIRAHGPHAAHEQYCMPDEMAQSPSICELRSTLEHRLSEGVVELKGAFVGSNVARSLRAGVAGLLARCHIHSIRLLGARYGMCTAARHVSKRWGRSGGRPIPGTIEAPYPDERFATTTLWWDLHDLDVDARTRSLVDRESKCLTEFPS